MCIKSPMSRIFIQLTTITATLLLLVFVVSFGWTMINEVTTTESTVKKEKITPIIVEKETGKTIVAFGDSLTRGTGDPEGKGYIGYLVEELKEKSDEEIHVTNLAVNGYRSNQLLEQLKTISVQSQMQNADTILMTIGGNDLFQGGQALIDLNVETITANRTAYLANINEALTLIRSMNENATIYFIGLYNPFIDLEDASVTSSVVRDWNYETNKVVDQHRNVIFVPTFDLFQQQVNDYLYSDKFHPNTKGYQLIAERVASLITW